MTKRSEERIHLSLTTWSCPFHLLHSASRSVFITPQSTAAMLSDCSSLHRPSVGLRAPQCKMGHCSRDAFSSNIQSYGSKAYRLMTQASACRKSSISAEIIMCSGLRRCESSSLNKNLQTLHVYILQLKVSLQMSQRLWMNLNCGFTLPTCKFSDMTKSFYICARLHLSTQL